MDASQCDVTNKEPKWSANVSVIKALFVTVFYSFQLWAAQVRRMKRRRWRTACGPSCWKCASWGRTSTTCAPSSPTAMRRTWGKTAWHNEAPSTGRPSTHRGQQRETIIINEQTMVSDYWMLDQAVNLVYKEVFVALCLNAHLQLRSYPVRIYELLFWLFFYIYWDCLFNCPDIQKPQQCYRNHRILLFFLSSS